VLHSSGKSIIFHRDAQGRITSITDPAGNSFLYAYDPATGNLQSATTAPATPTSTVTQRTGFRTSWRASQTTLTSSSY